MSIRLASYVRCNNVRRDFSGRGILPILLFVLIVTSAAISQTIPYSVNDIEKLAKQGTEEHGFLESVKRHGINFAPTLDVIKELKASHVPDSVLKEILAHIPQGQPPEFYVKEGDRLMTNGYFEEAAEYYRKTLALLPGDLVATGRLKQAEEEQQKAEAEAKEQQQKAEAAAKLRAAQDNERPNLSYYREQMGVFLEKSDCDGAFYYAHKIFFVGPDQAAKSAFEKVCGAYSLTLNADTSVTLEFQRDLTGSGANFGDKIDFTVVNAIVVNGLLVAPQGAIAWGKVVKAAGDRSFLRVGRLGINIEGMSLADGQNCSLEAEVDYHGEKKSKKRKTGIVIGTTLTLGLPIPFLIHGRGKDVTVAAGTKVTARVAEKMSLDPERFDPSGPTPAVGRIVLPPKVKGLSVMALQNVAGTDATVKLMGPSVQILTVVDGQILSPRVAAGDYYLLVRYGKNPSDYIFDKAGPISVIEPSGQHWVGHVTLRKPLADSPKAREEFNKGQ
jgi:hypothetical protein